MNRLSKQDIEEITGISGDGHQRAQCNRLKNMGIHACINDKREVICFWSWVDAAALPEDLLKNYIEQITPDTRDTEKDIGLNFDSFQEAS